MNFIFGLFFLGFFSNSAPKGKVVEELFFEALNPPQFTYEMSADQLQITFTETASGRKSTFSPEFTVAADKKLTFSPKGKPSLELLLIVLSKGNIFQVLQVFVPSTASKFAGASGSKPVCSIENTGDFSIDTESDFRKRFRVVKVKDKSEMQIRVGKSKSGKIPDIKQQWQKCFSY